MSKAKKILIAISLIFIIFLLLVPTLDYKITDLSERQIAPSIKHLFGTDMLGRDLLALMKAGLIRTLTVVIVASLISLTFGLVLGIFSSYVGGSSESFIKALIDMTLIIPSFIVALIITALIGLTPVTAGCVLGFFNIGDYAHQANRLTNNLKNEEFMICLEKMNIPKMKILFSHIMPNIIKPIMSNFGNRASSVILSYASLSFVGLGTDINTPDWGTMLYQYKLYVFDAPYLVLFPMLGIFMVSIFFTITFDRD